MITTENLSADKAKKQTNNNNEKRSRKSALLSITLTAFMSVAIALCSYITIPAPVPFTMQTFGIFLALMMLGGKGGTIAILIYILLGVIGLPVFSSLGAGAGYLLGPTGGYILGFLLCGVFYMLTEKLRKTPKGDYLFLSAGLLICYISGTLWFLLSGSGTTEAQGIWQALSLCVLPYVIPDIAKLLLASYISKRLKAIYKI